MTNLEYASKKKDFRRFIGRKPSLVVVNVNPENYAVESHCPLPERFDAIFAGYGINESTGNQEKQPFFYIKRYDIIIKLKSCFSEIECLTSDGNKKEVKISPWPDCLIFEMEAIYGQERERAENLFGRAI